MVRLDDALLLKQAKPAGAGMVAVTADEAGRFTRFAICMQGLSTQLPAGSRTVWQVGNDIAGNRNAACEALLAEDDGGEWIWFVDDDHAFREDIIAKLLARDVDVVTPLCLRRVQPFLPVPCVEEDFMDVTRYEPDALVEVQHAGSSGMLIRRRVLEQVEPPWFELANGVSEDVAFCVKAKAAGFKIHVDMGVRLGHMTTAVIWPVWNEDEERWLTGFTIADGAQLAIDPAVASVEEPETV